MESGESLQYILKNQVMLKSRKPESANDVNMQDSLVTFLVLILIIRKMNIQEL